MENAQSITYKVVALAVIILVIVSAALPALQDAEEQVQPTQEYTNTNMYAQNISSVKETTTLVFDGTSILINGVALSSIVSVMPLASDTCFIYAGSGGVPAIYYVLNSEYVRVLNLTAFNLTVNPVAKTVTGTFTTESATTEISTVYSQFAFVKSNAVADYVYVDTNFQPTYYYSDDIHCLQYSTVLIASSGDKAFINGVQSGSVTINSTPVEGSRNVKELSGVTNTTGSNMTITNAEDTYYPHWVIVPTKVLSYDSDGSPIYSSLIAIIPLLLIIAAVLFAVRMIGSSRN